MVPSKSTAEEVSFEWSHHTVGLLNMSSFIDFGSERVKQLELVDLHLHV